jgi:hypothetical protein
MLAVMQEQTVSKRYVAILPNAIFRNVERIARMPPSDWNRWRGQHDHETTEKGVACIYTILAWRIICFVKRNYFSNMEESRIINRFIIENYLTIAQEINDTVRQMQTNINKISERGERLDSLQDKTDNLAVSAQGFRRGANRVRKQMWWKDMKMRICIIVGIIILLIVIIVPAGKHTQYSSL